MSVQVPSWRCRGLRLRFTLCGQVLALPELTFTIEELNLLMSLTKRGPESVGFDCYVWASAFGLRDVCVHQRFPSDFIWNAPVSGVNGERYFRTVWICGATSRCQ